MKVKKIVKLAKNIPIVLSFRGYEVTYKAGKMINSISEHDTFLLALKK